MFHPKIVSFGLAAAALVLGAGCSSDSSRYYQNDGPPGLFQKKLVSWGGDTVTLKVEQPNKWANRPYTVLGKRYYPVTGDKPMNQVGTASWYGKQFHGKKTAIGEIYDMHALTAAHPTMELPSYAKVTNLKNGRSIIVRVNDRGPFLHGRVIDLSYAAAVRLGYEKQGTARVRVERITRRDIAAGRIPSASASDTVVASAPARVKETPRTVPAPTSRTLAAAPVPAAAPAPVPSAGRTPEAETAYSEANAVTLSIPVESAETAGDPMQALAASAGDPAPEPEPEPPAPAQVLPASVPADASGGWAVQIGAYGVQENARQAAAHAEMMLASVQNASVQIVDNGKVWKVLSGSFASKDEASRYARTVSEALGTPAFAVAR